MCLTCNMAQQFVAKWNNFLGQYMFLLVLMSLIIGFSTPRSNTVYLQVF
ncbi:hypothetical protein MAMMFC1_00687 [Methylomusa anaerophila]|uniref:Uncharacterized protein n=1 Tax=Methylomusa anaerophila TaxID=1930071 RepID=A0A348AG41_9FIRM|nr:hypothetical protein MAMMFC1_00687 [Methylomusa anaerophila]